jgi:hypothetical protein
VFGLDLAPLDVKTPAAGKGVGKSSRKASRKVAGRTAAVGKKKKGRAAGRQGRV